MDLKDLKNKQVSALDRANSLVESLGINADLRTTVVGLSRGDVFKLANLRVANETQFRKDKEDNKAIDFLPLVFITDTGASLGVKHFAKVEFPSNMKISPVGATAAENAAFLIDCIDNDISFEVERIKTTEKEYNGNKYEAKLYELSVVSKK